MPIQWLFYACLVLGALFGLLSVFGGGDADGDADISDIDADGDSISIMSLIGWGKVPVFLALSIGLLVFGAGGLIAEKAGHSSLIASVIGFCAALILGGLLTRAMVRTVPALETSNATVSDLKGQLAEVIFPQEPENNRDGVLSVYFKHDMYRLNYVSDERFQKGDSVLIVEINPETSTCTVCADPTKSA